MTEMMISMVVDPKQAESLAYQAAAELCRRNFFEFVRFFWHTVVPEKPVWNWHLPFLCQELQKTAERVVRRQPKEYDLLINIPPGSTKSTICSIMFPVWTWIRDPALRSICGSYDHGLSLFLSTRSRDIVRSDLFQRMFPHIQMRQDLDTKGHYANTAGGERFSTSVGGSVTGHHGHFLIVDDPIDPRGAVSEQELKTVNDWMTHTLPTRKVDKTVSVIILIMQRLHEQDPSGRMLELMEESPKEKPVKWICIPCDDSWSIHPEELREKYEGGLMDPVRLPKKVLHAARVDLGPLEYAGQFGQSPRAREGAFFDVQQFLERVVDSPPSRVVRTVRYWDKAGTEGGDGSRTAGVKISKMASGQYIVEHAVTGRWEAIKREKRIKAVAEMDSTRVQILIEQEPGSGGKESAENTIRNLAGYRIRADRVTGDKVLRAEPWSIQVNAGNVFILRGSWNQSYVDEHSYFPRGKYKDQVDASAGAFAELAGITTGKRGGVW